MLRVTILRFLLAFLLLGAATTTDTKATTDASILETPNSTELALFAQDERDLALSVPNLPVGPLGKLLCPLLRLAFLFTMECECITALWRLYIDVDCSRYICSPLGTICGSANFTFGFSILPPKWDTGICVDVITLFNDNFPALGPYCVGIDNKHFRDDCPKGLANCIASKKAFKIKNQNFVAESCTVTLAGKECNSCTTTDGNGGIVFDCDNVLPNFVVTEPVHFSLYFGPGSKSTGEIPRIPDIPGLGSK